MTVSSRWRDARWRLYAPVYDWVAKPFERGRRRAIERLEPRRDERVLLVGCGTGLDLEHLPLESDVTAVDIVPDNLVRTTERSDALGRETHVCLGDAGTLPFAADAFDAVLLHLVLSVVPDPNAVVAEAERVLAADGRVSVFDKFVAENATPSRLRRALNPLASLLFSDITRRLGPMLVETDLAITGREWVLGDLYTVAIARTE